MLQLLARRLETFEEGSLKARAEKGRRLRGLIGDAVVLPGQGNAHHDYWTFPLLVDDPVAFIKGLRATGFDAATLPRSQAVAAPEGYEKLEPNTAAQAIADLIVAPCYPGMPDKELVREAEAIRAIAVKVGGKRTKAYALGSDHLKAPRT